MRLIGHWLSDFLRLALGLGAALAAMQVPALTSAYDSGLVQAAGELRRDIDARKEVARHFYGLTDMTDPGVVGALRQKEPANAQGLESSIAREDSLRAAHARMAESPALLRPLVAAWDLAEDPLGNKQAVLEAALALHEPSIGLSIAPATYGLAGLLLGLLLANLAVGLCGAMARRREKPGRPFTVRP